MVKIDWIKEKARSDSQLPTPTLAARMRWYKDKVLTAEATPTQQENNDSIKKTRHPHEEGLISQQTESEFHSAVTNLRARMNSIVDNTPQLKNFTPAYGDHRIEPINSDVNKNFAKSQERSALFNGFYDSKEIEMQDMSKKDYCEVNIDEAIDFRLQREQVDSDSPEDPNSTKKKKKKKKRKSNAGQEGAGSNGEIIDDGEKGTMEQHEGERKGLTRAQRRKKLKQIKMEEKEKEQVSERGKLESGEVKAPPPPEEQRPRKRTIKAMREEKERMKDQHRLFAQVATGANGEGLPIILFNQGGKYSDGPSHIIPVTYHAGAANSEATQSVLVPQRPAALPQLPAAEQVKARTESDENAEKNIDQEFPEWVLEDEREKRRKKKTGKGKENKAAGIIDRGDGSNSEQSDQNTQKQTKAQREDEDEEEESKPTQLAEVALEQEMEETNWDIDDGDWDTVSTGNKKDKTRKTADRQFDEQTATTARATGSSENFQAQNKSQTVELGVNNEELWPGLSAANANFHSNSKSQRSVSYAQRLKRSRSFEEESKVVSKPIPDIEPDQSSFPRISQDVPEFPDSEPTSLPEIIPVPSPPPKQKEETIFDEILGAKRNGLNFLVGSCEDLSNDECPVLPIHTDDPVKFIFVDETAEVEEEDATKDETSVIAITGELIAKLISKQLPTKIIHTDVSIPDYSTLIKFHEKCLKSVYEKEKTSAKTIRYVS